MEKVLKVEIVTPKEVIYSGNATAVTLPGSKSPFQVLYNHTAIVSNLDKGKIIVKETNGNEIIYKAESGFAEINKNVISVLVESATTN